MINRATLETADFVDDPHAGFSAAELMGIAVAEFSERTLDSVEILRASLS